MTLATAGWAASPPMASSSTEIPCLAAYASSASIRSQSTLASRWAWVWCSRRLPAGAGWSRWYLPVSSPYASGK